MMAKYLGVVLNRFWRSELGFVLMVFLFWALILVPLRVGVEYSEHLDSTS